jgi:FXSXX-COOH protein
MLKDCRCAIILSRQTYLARISEFTARRGFHKLAAIWRIEVMCGEPGGAEDGLIDLSGLSLRDLDECDESSLKAELRRILGSDPDGSGAIADFNNSV